jgi:hypothetical protein
MTDRKLTEAEAEEIATQSFVTVSKMRMGAEVERVKDESEVMSVRKFVTEPAIIRRGYGVTINMGNYESVKIDVGLYIPAYIEEIESVDEFAQKWCKGKMEMEQNEVIGVKGGAKGSKKGPGF